MGCELDYITICFIAMVGAAARKGNRMDPSPRILLIVGLAQVMALVPGVSRAGITITAGLWQGLPLRQLLELLFYFLFRS